VKTVMFTPSGVNSPPSLDEAARPAGMSHRSPRFAALLDEVRALLLRCLGGDSSYEALLLCSSGTGALEAALGAADGPILVVVNGRYSQNLVSIAQAHGHDVRTLALDPFSAVDPAEVQRALDRDGSIRTLAVVHCETTTGVLAPLAALCRAAASRGVVTVVDAIGSAGAHDVGLGPQGPDWLVLTSGKALEGVPGLSFVVSRRALLDGGSLSRRGFYLDVARNWAYQRAGQVAHTVPTVLVTALREALRYWESETPQGRRCRYAVTTDALRAGLVQRGFELVPLPRGQRSNVVVPVRLPSGVDFARVQGELVESGMEIYFAADALERGYFFLAAIGRIEPPDLWAFLDALAASCRRRRAMHPADGRDARGAWHR
jgi:2-aminoethylphosphonate-pyruvate transaminase